MQVHMILMSNASFRNWPNVKYYKLKVSVVNEIRSEVRLWNKERVDSGHNVDTTTLIG